MSSPTNTPRRTPKRTTPKRTPLGERSPSQKNERRTPLQERNHSPKNAGARLHGESKTDLTDPAIFTTTPFPTKPQHVLLPSTIRKQRSKQNAENELPGALFNSSATDIATSATGSRGRQDAKRVRRAPNLQLKKSVTALRDMYEAQAESSRPSTAMRSRTSSAAPSPLLRPTSSRMRSLSSSDGFSGRGAWEMLGLPKVSEDDLATLPTLSEGIVNRLESEQSFASRVRQGSTSPNFGVFDGTSPVMPTYHDLATSSDPVEPFSMDIPAVSSPNVVQLAQTSDPASDEIYGHNAQSIPNFVGLAHSSSSQETDRPGKSTNPFAASSPNFQQLLHSSSFVSTDQEQTDAVAGESSPNVFKLGTSSPRRSSSPTPSVASTESRKRKRCDVEGLAYAGRTPLFFGGRSECRPTSSPPLRIATVSSDNSLQSVEQRVLPSSPPEVDSVPSQSSPVYRLQGRMSADRSSVTSAHTNLQSILSSSPAPPVPRPIIRAPNVNQFEVLALQKRTACGPSTGEISNGIKLSPVPSATDLELSNAALAGYTDFPQRSASRASVFTEDLEEEFDVSLAPIKAYMQQEDLNSSRVNIISDADRHEAADELSALPRQQSSFAAILGQARNAGTAASSANSSSTRLDSFRTSVDSRLHTMRSFTHNRNDSLKSYRPGTSNSFAYSAAVPTWARHYYAGVYQNSFQYLYQSATNLSYAIVHIPPRGASMRSSMPASLQNSSSYETISSKSNHRRSWSQSVRSSIKSFIPPRLLSSTRPRLDVRQSHLTVGVGPLVSNPTRPKSEMVLRPATAYQNRQSIRRVSAPVAPVDPRYHWNGIIEEADIQEEGADLEEQGYSGTPRYSTASSMPRPIQASTSRYITSARFLSLSTPHLHTDKRLNTASTTSQGFGAPYNMRPTWQPSPIHTDKLGRPSWYKVDIKDMQVVCFIAGFVCPLTWFVGAFSPLPHRPDVYQDLEKNMYARNSFGQAYNDFEQGDIVARLRLEKHVRGLEEVKWQNARWWRRMNRWMCCVGLVVLSIIVVLAVIGTKGHWS